MRACIKLWPALAIGFALLAGSLRAESLYVANFNSNSVSGFRIGPNAALTPLLRFALPHHGNWPPIRGGQPLAPTFSREGLAV